MSKKLLIVMVIVAIVLVGGYFGFRIYQTQQAEKAYQAYLQSPDKVADDVLKALINQDVSAAKAMFTPTLQSGYSDDFLKNNYFPILQDYKNQPKRVSKKAVVATDPNSAPPYNPTFHQDPQEYLYDFTLDNLTYRIRIVIIKDIEDNNKWKVNELTGGYLS